MKAQPAVARAVSFEGVVRALLVAVYVAIIVVCFTTGVGPRIFWTIALPALIMSIVLMGYNTWRRICPLAFWGSFGVRIKRGKTKARKVPEWMERWFFLISLGFLVTMLVVRLVLINGDGPILGITLILIGGLAALVNYTYSGRTWCNFICPVGTVERIYTDPNSLRQAGNSQCAKCTACKLHCPDIDHENAYWKDVMLPSRRMAFFSFPGVVLGFYTYYYLRGGTWEAYFSGAWTRHPASVELAFGPGFFFAPWIPALPAAIITIVGFAATSYFVFAGVERLMKTRIKDGERIRHLTLSLAAFFAFNFFYLFAGAPTLRLIPGATRLVAFVVPLVSAIFLYKRWTRSGDDYVKVKSAKRLLPLWKSKTPPPSNPAEIFSYFQGRNEAHATQVTAYEEVVREILANGVVTPHDLGLLAQMRTHLDITETEHRKIFSALSEQDRSLFDPAQATSVERRLQLQGYQNALTQLLMRQASPDEIRTLQQDYAIEPEVHEAVLRTLRGDASPLVPKIKKQVERVMALRTLEASLELRRDRSVRAAFVADMLQMSEQHHVAAILDALRPLGDAAFQSDLRQLAGSDGGGAWDHTRKVLGSELTAQLERVLLRREGIPPVDEPAKTIEALLADSETFHRAGGALLLSEQTALEFVPLLRRALVDNDPLVRETAIHAAVQLLESAGPQARQSLETDTDGPLAASLHAIDGLGKAAAEDGKLSTMLGTFEKMMYLHQVPLFASLAPDDLYELSVLAQEVELGPQDLVVREGDSADDLYVITSGQTEATVLRDGTARVIGTDGPGHVIGELAVIDGHPRSATVEAVSPQVKLLRIRGEDFRRVLEHRGDLSTQIMRILTQRLRAVLQSL